MMALERAVGLILRTTDWSETSRIATVWTREFGKARVLAKGGRRLRSNFENALDLLTLCSIVLLRKSSGSLDLLTEAQVLERFPRLRDDLQALYAAYYVAELLSDWTEDYDPHPALFDEAVATLRDLGERRGLSGVRLVRFELILLQELGYSPMLLQCAGCGNPAEGQELCFSAAGGGVLCGACRRQHRDVLALSSDAWRALDVLGQDPSAWMLTWEASVRRELRRTLNQYITYSLGKRPRMLPYLQS